MTTNSNQIVNDFFFKKNICYILNKTEFGQELKIREFELRNV